ncbi:MAG: DUF4266 domain-containing protein [Gammaproteobacteria bacterium]
MKIMISAPAALLFGAAICITGCSNVAPWERGHLAKAHMALEPYPEESAWRGHIYGSREAAAGKETAGGGGCGCY